MSRKIAFIVLLFCVVASTDFGEFSRVAVAQDPAERAYHVPVLNPKHKDKPKVKGWAKQRIEEKLNRGILAMPNKDGKVYLGWRLLKSDATGIAFNIYRSVEGGEPLKLNKELVTAATDFIDEQPSPGHECAYWVSPVVEGKELGPSEKVLLKVDAWDKPYYSSIKFQGSYGIQKMAVADLNSDGIYDFVVKQPGRSIDPGGRPDTSGLTYKLEAYLSDGTFLWRKDLGAGIEPGIWYSPYVVYDFDGDGKAEVAVKTGPEDARGPDGRVRSGPEWCSILDGMTGQEITRVDWPPRDPRLGDYNRTNRNQMGVACLDGKTPCLLVARGTYKLMVVDAYQCHDRKLERLWHWEGDDETPIIRSQGAHFMHSADIDEDGRDEVILGSCVLDDNGTCLWSVGLGHPDKCYVTDVDPTRPGLEVFYAIEPWHDGNGVCLVEARTGKTIWSIGQRTNHVGDGMVADIDPSLPGLECFATESIKGGSSDRYMFSANGKRLGRSEDVPDCTNWLFWDADLLRETVEGGFGFGGSGFGGFARGPSSIVKYKGPTLTTGIEGRIIMIADILGDWREEVITVLPGELRIYTTTIPAGDRRVCLMQDPLYRAEVAHLSMGYAQSPVTSYYLGVSPADAVNAPGAEPTSEGPSLPDKVAAKPLFRDPVYDGAADPVVRWNRQERKWFMFYTNRRANEPNTPGVSWVHGTRIGIAESSDGGATWKYRGTTDINYGKDDYTHWAPEVIDYNGTYHMFLSIVPGIFTDWNASRHIIHLTSKDMLKWKYESALKLASDRVIDACVIQLPDGTWRMWYKNERDHSWLYYADSPDLYTWTDRGVAINDQSGEGPKVFRWKNCYWLISDVWQGLAVYKSDDCQKWTRQKDNLLKEPGQSPTDRSKGQHADIIVSGDRAFLFYFTHQGGKDAQPDDPYSSRRTVIQVVELQCNDGRITCDRDKPTHVSLLPNEDKKSK